MIGQIYTEIESLYNEIVKPEIIDRVVSCAVWGHRQIEILINETSLTDDWKYIAIRIVESVPEILYCAAAVSGVGLFPASLFWTYRLATAVFPIVKTIFTGEVGAESLGKAAYKFWENLGENYHRLTPALAIVFTTASATNFVFGMTKGNAHAWAKAVVYFAVGSLAMKNMIFERGQEPQREFNGSQESERWESWCSIQ